MGESELRWLLVGVGALIILLIYLWGIRAHLKERLRERRRRNAVKSEPVLDDKDLIPDSDRVDHFGNLGNINRDHHLADKVLVDIEISPVERSVPKPTEAAVKTETQQKEADETPAEEVSTPTTSHPVDWEETLSYQTESATQLDAPEHLQPAKAQEEPHSVVPEAEQATPERLDEAQPREPETVDKPQMTVLVTVMAPPARPFKGSSILLAAQDLKLGLHRSGIFDCFPRDPSQNDPVFRIAHLREPGIFDINTVGKLVTPGLLLFMQLPGPIEPLQALELMMTVAKELAEKLGGNIYDASRHKMTIQTLTKLQNEVVEFDQQLKQYHQSCF